MLLARSPPFAHPPTEPGQVPSPEAKHPNLAIEPDQWELKRQLTTRITQHQRDNLQVLYSKLLKMHNDKKALFTSLITMLDSVHERMVNIQAEATSLVERQEQQLAPELSLSKAGEKILEVLYPKLMFNYFLVLSQPLESPLYKDRNFRLSVKMVNQHGRQVYHQGRVPLKLSLVINRHDPKVVQEGTLGQPAIRIRDEHSLQRGECLLEKVQVRLVTSHFIEGKAFLVIEAGERKGDFRREEVRPWVQQIVVKAKRLKADSL